MAALRWPRDLFHANIFYPEPRTLAFSEVMLPQALLGAPLTWLGVDPVLVYNLLVLAGFALSGFAMSWVIARWTGDRAAGVVAGLAYAFNANTLVRIGHLQALHVQYLPIALYALHLAIESPRPRWILLAYVHALWHHIDAENSVLFPECGPRLRRNGVTELPSRPMAPDEREALSAGQALVARYPPPANPDVMRGEGYIMCPAFGATCRGLELEWWNEWEWDEFEDRMNAG